MKSTMGGTCCHIVAQVPISTSPPAQFAIDASITSSRNISILQRERSVVMQRYAFPRSGSSQLRAADTRPMVACVVMNVAARSGPNS